MLTPCWPLQWPGGDPSASLSKRVPLRSLRLSAAADELTNLLAEAETNEMSYLSFADRLAEHELIQRQDKRIRRNRKMAAFPTEKRLEGFDYRHQTTITKRQVNALLDFQFLDERNNLVFIGPRV